MIPYGYESRIRFPYVWVEYSGSPVPIYYITEAAGYRCRGVAFSHLLMAVTSASEQARVRSKLVLWLQGD